MARACVPATRRRSISGTPTVGQRERVLERLLTGRGVVLLAEALLPDLGTHVARGTPAVEELTRTPTPTPGPRPQRRPGRRRRPRWLPHRHRKRLVRPTGQSAPKVGGDGERGALGGHGGTQSPERAPHRSQHVVRRGSPPEAQRGVHRVGVRPVEIRRRHRAVPQRSHVDRSRRAKCVPRRLHRHGRGVLVERRDRPLALSAAPTGDAGDLLQVQTAIWEVGAVPGDATHDRHLRGPTRCIFYALLVAWPGTDDAGRTPRGRQERDRGKEAEAWDCSRTRWPW